MPWPGAQNAQCTCQKWRGLYTHCFPCDVHINHHNLLLFFLPKRNLNSGVGLSAAEVVYGIEGTAGHPGGLQSVNWVGQSHQDLTAVFHPFLLDEKAGELSLSEQNTWEKTTEHLWPSLLRGEAALLAADLHGCASQFRFYTFGAQESSGSKKSVSW